MQGTDPIEYLANRHLGSLKWLLEPNRSRAPTRHCQPTPSRHCLAGQCTCCAVQVCVLGNIANFLNSQELSVLACASAQLARGVYRREGVTLCNKGFLFPAFKSIEYIDGNLSKEASSRGKMYAKYVPRPLRNQSDGHSWYYLDLARPERVAQVNAGASMGEKSSMYQGRAERMSGNTGWLGSPHLADCLDRKRRFGVADFNRRGNGKLRKRQLCQAIVVLLVLVTLLAGFALVDREGGERPPPRASIGAAAFCLMLALLCLMVGLCLGCEYLHERELATRMRAAGIAERSIPQSPGVYRECGAEEAQGLLLAKGHKSMYGTSLVQQEVILTLS